LQRNDQIRLERTRKFYGIASVILLLVSVYLIWALKTILIPVIIGFFAAYICLPILNKLKGKGYSRTSSVCLLLSGFFLVILFLFQAMSASLPDENERVEFKVSLLFNIQDKYQFMMGLKSEEEGNVLYRLTGNELDPIVRDVSCYLKLDADEKEKWQRREGSLGLHSPSETGYQEMVSSLNCNSYEQGDSGLASIDGQLIPVTVSQPALLSSVFQFLSVWFIMPFIFVYTLLDNGKTRNKMIYLIPNAYFEVALTTLHSVDKAIGTYLRCLASNILIISILFAFLLKIIGFETAPAIVIGLLNGLLNSVPVIGSLIGLLVILIYAIVIQHPETILPFIDRENIILWSFFVYVLIQIIDNLLLKPFLMGKAVNLNPLIIILTVVGGAVIGGFIGILLAIPLVLILKVGFTTLRAELKRYSFIY